MRRVALVTGGARGIGAAVFSTLGYFYAANKGRSQSAAMRFVPSKKPTTQEHSNQEK